MTMAFRDLAGNECQTEKDFVKNPRRLYAAFFVSQIDTKMKNYQIRILIIADGEGNQPPQHAYINNTSMISS
jgi:hypothetical protein